MPQAAEILFIDLWFVSHPPLQVDSVQVTTAGEHNNI